MSPSIRTHLTRSVALLVIAVLAGACSSPVSDPPREARAAGAGEDSGRTTSKERRAAAAADGAERATDGPAATAKGTSTPGTTDGEKRRAARPGSNSVTPNRTRQDPAVVTAGGRVVSVADLVGDPEGEGSMPPYMDLDRVRLRGGRTYVVRLTFAGVLPRRTGDAQTTMIAGIETSRGERHFSIYAELTNEGWRARTSRSEDFPGALTVRGATLTFEIDRSYLGRSFRWYAHSSWTSTTLLKTDYFFDFAPDDQRGRFPGRRR